MRLLACLLEDDVLDDPDQGVVLIGLFILRLVCQSFLQFPRGSGEEMTV